MQRAQVGVQGPDTDSTGCTDLGPTSLEPRVTDLMDGEPAGVAVDSCVSSGCVCTFTDLLNPFSSGSVLRRPAAAASSPRTMVPW